MLYKDEDGNTRKIKELKTPPPMEQIIKHSEYWNKRKLTYKGTAYYFDHPIRTGVCYFCKIEGRAQGSKITSLHHTKYEDSDKLAWTIEVCKKCHSKIDPYNRKIIQRNFASRYSSKAVNKKEEQFNERVREAYFQEKKRNILN